MSFDPTKLVTVAENVPKVYNAGYEKGKAEGGSDSWYDTFWDTFQMNGTPRSYAYAFKHQGWTPELLKPKYDIIPTKAGYMFHENAQFAGVDLAEHFETIGRKLDFSQCTDFSWLIYGSKIARIGVVDMSGVTANQDNVFRDGGGSRLHTIDKLIPPNGFKIGGSSFTNCTKLENVTIDGTIYAGFAVSACPLTVESMKSIILHLNNYAGTDEEFTYPVKFSSACWELLEADSTAPHGGTWQNYVETLGWNT